MNTTKTPIETVGTATYSPEDNKLRLYVGRVPRPEYDRLREEGWTPTPKQTCQFAAVWTPERRDTALEFAELIEDEDQGPDERAADRAERFGSYREKRLGEAVGLADNYDTQPSAHGYQSARRAERMAARHDRLAGHSLDAWSKAEYWQRRTAGVISHSLHVSSPSVRMGRIKEIESEIRKLEKSRSDYQARFDRWTVCAGMTGDEQTKRALALAYVEHGDYVHPRTGRKSYLYDHMKIEEDRNADALNGVEVCALWLAAHKPLGEEGDWITHYRLRLAYENQMLEAQGGRLAHEEIIVGGWLGGMQIHKVNKSPATGRVTSVHCKGPAVKGWTYKAANVPGTDYALHQFDTERLAPGAYRAPTTEELATFAAERKAGKAAKPKVKTVPLINPTDADAERLQALWNEKARQQHIAQKSYGEFVTQKVLQITQAVYSSNSSGSYARLETITLNERGTEARKNANGDRNYRHLVCKVRKGCGEGDNWGKADRVIVITDKPRKPLPFARMETLLASCPSRENMKAKLPDLQRELGKSWLHDADRALLDDGVYVGWVSIQSMSQFYFTPAGDEAMKAFKAEMATTV